MDGMARQSVVIACFALIAGVAGVEAGVQDFQHPTTGTSNFVVTIGHSYYDSGGPDCAGTGGEYSNNENGVAVLCPGTPGQFVTIEFLDVDVETRTSEPGCWDTVSIYNGDSTAAPLLFGGCGEEGFASCTGSPGDGGDCLGVEGGSCDMHGSNDPEPVNNVFTSTDSTGCLTVEFVSDGSVQEGGWVATVTAAIPVELMQIVIE
jgi:hypothetical protein